MLDSPEPPSVEVPVFTGFGESEEHALNTTTSTSYHPAPDGAGAGDAEGHDPFAAAEVPPSAVSLPDTDFALDDEDDGGDIVIADDLAEIVADEHDDTRQKSHSNSTKKDTTPHDADG